MLQMQSLSRSSLIPHRARLLVVEHDKGKPSITRLNSTGRLERSSIRATGSIWSGLKEDTRKAIWRSLKSDLALPPEYEWSLHSIKAVDPPSLFARALVRFFANLMHDGMCEDGYTVVFVANFGYRGQGEEGIVDLGKDKAKSKDAAPKKKKEADTGTANIDHQFEDPYDEIWQEQAQYPEPLFHAHEMSGAMPPPEPPPGAIPVPLVHQNVNSHAIPFPPRIPSPPASRWLPQAQAQPLHQSDDRHPRELAMDSSQRTVQYDLVEDQTRRRRAADALRAQARLRSHGQHGFWSTASSSSDRRYDYTAPERLDPNRQEHQFSRRASSGARPYFDDRKRYYMNRHKDRPSKPHISARERARYTDSTREQRQSHDDQPLSRPDAKISASADRVAFRPRASLPEEAREFLSSSSARTSSPDRDARRCSSGATRRAKEHDRARRALLDRALHRDRQWVSEQSSDDSSSADQRYQSPGRRLSRSPQGDDREVSEVSDETLDDAELYAQLLRKFTGHGLRESESDDDEGAGGEVVEVVEVVGGLTDESVDDDGHDESHVDAIFGRNVDETVDENGNGIADGDTHDDITDPTPRASGVDQVQSTTT